MFDITRKSIEWGGRTLSLESGRVARQADGAVMARYGDTVVLATAVGAKSPKEGIDFFPLTVNYQEKYSAAGRIPGGFFKREGRPTEKETLTSRLIDRPIRPLFVDGYKNETQVIITVLSHDLENDSDVLAMVAASLVAVIVLPTALDPVPVAMAGLRSALVPLVLIGLMECRSVTPANTGAAFGLWFAVAEVGGFTGPLSLGAVADSSWGFAGAFSLVVVVCGLLVVPTARLRRRTSGPGRSGSAG